MNFQQLRSVREAVRCNFNLTEVAAMLFTSQPGVSRQIRELEDELGVEIFVRAGKRLTGLTVAATHSQARYALPQVVKEFRDQFPKVTLEQLTRYPIITYEMGYTGRAHIDEAFRVAGLHPQVVLTAMDADVIKTYVELGMGGGHRRLDCAGCGARHQPAHPGRRPFVCGERHALGFKPAAS